MERFISLLILPLKTSNKLASQNKLPSAPWQLLIIPSLAVEQAIYLNHQEIFLQHQLELNPQHCATQGLTLI